MTTLWTGSIPEDALEVVQHRIDRLARRALRQGFPVPTLRLGQRGIREYQGLTVRGIDIYIEAEGMLRLGDWTFVGVVSELGDGQPFVTFAPGIERMELPFTVVNYCDHCRTSRQRNDTYVVQSATEGVKQVGSSCIKDFTGHSPAAIVGWLRAVEEVTLSEDEVDGWYRNAQRFYDPKEVIGYAARIVARDGYVSKAKAEESDTLTSTTELLRGWMTARGREWEQFASDYPATHDSETLENDTWNVLIAQRATDSDWETDIYRLANSEGVQWRHVGILGSAVILGLRLQERRARDAEKGVSNFIGSEGERLTLVVKVTGKFAYSGAYGSSYVIRMVANESDELVTFTGAKDETDAIEAGNRYQVTGTIKKHELDSRSGRPTTVLTRTKWVGWAN